MAILLNWPDNCTTIWVQYVNLRCFRLSTHPEANKYLVKPYPRLELARLRYFRLTEILWRKIDIFVLIHWFSQNLFVRETLTVVRELCDTIVRRYPPTERKFFFYFSFPSQGISSQLTLEDLQDHHSGLPF